jgi:hypothetical protein
VHAVVERAVSAIEADIVSSLSAGDAETDPAALIERVFRAFADQGHARLIAWLSLSGVDGQQATSRLGDIAELVHAMRKARLEADGVPCPSFEDTSFVVLLSTFALLGDAICGRAIRDASSLGSKDPTGERFRAWLAERLVQHLEHPGASSERKR